MIVDSHGNAYPPAGSASSGGRVGALQGRADSWVNELTGVGSSGDKSIFGRFATVRRVTDTELTNLHNGSPLAAKIIEKRPTEMFRPGYVLTCDDLDVSEVKDLQDYAEEELHLSEVFLDATIEGNKYGGDLVVMGLDDGNIPDAPLDEDRIKTFTFLNGFDRRFSYVLDYYDEPGPNYSRAAHYLTSNAVAGYQYGSGRNAVTRRRAPSALERSGFYTSTIHESRCIRFEGIRTDVVTQQTLAGWTWSVLQRVYDSLRKFEHSMDSARYLLSDASQAVLTLKGLIDAISSGHLAAIQTRLAVMEMNRSVIHGIAIDEGEKYERQETPLGGIDGLLAVMMLVLAADTGYPVTELFGRAASGLNAAAGSDSETRKWYDQIHSERTIKLAPKYQRAYRLIARSGDCPVKLPKVGKTGKPLKFEMEWNPLYQLTDAEQADTELKRAQRDQIYLQETVVTPEELALDVQDLYPSMDVEAREAAQEGEIPFDPYAKEPEPPPPVVVAGVPGVPGPKTPPAPPVGGGTMGAPVANAARTTPAPPAKRGAKPVTKKTPAKPSKPKR